MPNWLDDMEEDLDPVQYPDENEMQNAPPPVDVPSDDSAFAYAEPSEPKPMHPLVQDFLKTKYNIGERQKLIDQNNSDLSGPDFSSALASIGAGFQGKDALGAGMAFRKSREEAAANKLEQFDKSRAAALEDKKAQVAQDQLAREMDPNSDESKLAQDLAKQLGVPDTLAKGISAAKFKSISPGYEKLFKIKADAEAKKTDRIYKENMLEATRAASHSDKQNQYLSQTSTELESARGNPAVAQAEKDIYAANKAQGLANLYGDPNKLTKSQVNLLASEIGKIASGGVPSMHELEGITPQTLTGRLSRVVENLTNDPTPANAAAFVKQLTDYSGALKKDAQKVINDKYGRILESRKRQLHPDDYNSLKDQYLGRFEQEQESSGPTLEDLLAEKRRRMGQ